MSGLRDWLPMPLQHIAVLHADSPTTARRRRRVVAGTSVVGAGLLGAGLSAEPGSRRFYACTGALAATLAAGGLGSGPLHLGYVERRDRTLVRPLLLPVATGVGAFGVFAAAALAVKRVPALRRWVGDVLAYADGGETRSVLLVALSNAAAEEVFFRGALYAAVPPPHAIWASTAVYTVGTTTTRNPALVLAAGAMGTLFALQRRATGGIQAPALTHLTWSTLMIRYLPRLWRRGH